MPLRINVELKDGSVCLMAKKAFNVFLSLDEVAKFKRSNGWIAVDEGSLRDLGKDSDYTFCAERRASL
jgi:predicted ribosome-associated RNA-binding protein Tma20